MAEKDTSKKEEKEIKTVKKTKTVKEPKEEAVREVIVEKKVGFNYLEVIVIMIITLILGGVIGSFVTYVSKDNRKTNNTNSSVVDTNKYPEGLDEFLKTYNSILEEYYEKVDEKELIEAGINGMLEYLGDDYSVYMNKETTKQFNEQVEGHYKGIGVEITTSEDHTEITRVFSNSPASKAGLKAQDVFLKVDNEDVSNKNANEISKLIKESGKTEVKVVVKRGNEELTFTLKLEEVIIDTVETEIFEKNGKKVGYIGVSVFASNTYEQFKEKLEKLEKDGIDSLVIDVRGNSGGYLTTVTDMASLFLNKSKIIYQLDTKGIVEQVYSRTKESRSYPIAILVNKYSASASEILAAALQESYGAKVVGTNSFGKGTVQRAYTLESGATIKYTVQKWLTPKGNWINKTGIKPDIEVELDEEYSLNPSNETDKQLQTALEEVTK